MEPQLSRRHSACDRPIRIIRSEHAIGRRLSSDSFRPWVDSRVFPQPANAQYKIAKIVCFSAVAETLDQGNYGNLHKMVTETLSHIDARFESLCSYLTAELVARSYGELDAMEEMTYSKPELGDIGQSRARH